MTEKLTLGLRIGEEVSAVRDRKNLSYLLTQVEERRAVDIDGIRRSLVEATGAEIPIEFLFDTGLVELHWQQIYHQNALSAVYLGVKEKQISPVEFSGSEAIIAVHSNVCNQRVEASSVEISSVVADSRGRERVLSVLYDAHSLKVNRSLVSIADDEKSKFPFDIHPDYPREEEARLVKIPSMLLDSYFPLSSRPLVSLRMSWLAHEDMRMVEAHTMDGQSWYIPFRDYFQGQEGSNRIIGRGKTSDDFSWTVSYPGSLTPVKSK